MPARTHASQGEQRTLALALRLAAHRLVAERTGSTPVLVLDDVLSELDPGRATALLGHLPPGQVVITTASAVPPAARPERDPARRTAGAVVGDDVGGGAEASPVSADEPVPFDRLRSTACCGRCAAAPGGPRSAACSAAGRRPSARPIAAHVRPVRLEDGHAARRGRRPGVGDAGPLPRRRPAQPPSDVTGRRGRASSRCASAGRGAGDSIAGRAESRSGVTARRDTPLVD